MRTLLASLMLVALACTTPSPPPAPVEKAAVAPAPAPQAAPAPAPQATPAPAPQAASADTAAPRVETATFAVPGLDALVATNMAAALAAVPGVKAARPRIADGRFEIDFTPPAATPDALLAALKGVSAAVTLEGVKPANGGPAHEGGCGSCPMKDSCGGHPEPGPAQ